MLNLHYFIFGSNTFLKILIEIQKVQV